MLKKLTQIGVVTPETVLVPRCPMSGSSSSLLGLSQMEANDAIEILKAFPKRVESHIDGVDEAEKLHRTRMI
jgi:hypothetical protein